MIIMKLKQYYIFSSH